jgi:hypothetical protein
VTLLEREVGPALGIKDDGEEALIKEARRLRRRRWIIGSALAALALGAGVGGFLVASGPPSRMNQGPSNGSSGSGSALAARVLVPTRSPDLIQPTTLATLPDGNLLILDSSRDQILELRPGGHLSVFAGDGRLGFSGDGGPAQDAELKMTSLSGMAVTSAGTVDLLEGGSCRIRAISPNGIIRTILRVPLVKVYPHGTGCPVTAFAVSPAGSVYIAMSSGIERVSSRGQLVWVAGAHGSEAYITPSHAAFFPSALVFDNAGDLYIWNFSPKVIFRLDPTGALTQLSGASYATQLTTAPNGAVLAGAHGGVIQEVTPTGVRALYDVVPKRVSGIHWGRDQGFQEDGIAVTKTGTIYVDNAQGNGYGDGAVIVQISPTRHAALVPIHTPLAATLPRVNAAGFPASLFPAARGSRGPSVRSCPSDQGVGPFTTGAIAQAKRIAKTYLSNRFASDIAVTDRSWWTSDFNQYADGNVGGNHTVTGEGPTSGSPTAAGLAQACGADLIRDSIAVTVGRSASSDLTGTIYFLDRNGHPLVYDVH